MSTWEMIAEKAKALPRQRQKELLDFAEFLEKRDTEPHPLRSSAGLCADLGVHITAEEIAEVRREMWAGFPRGDI